MGDIGYQAGWCDIGGREDGQPVGSEEALIISAMYSVYLGSAVIWKGRSHRSNVGFS